LGAANKDASGCQIRCTLTAFKSFSASVRVACHL
jgi:hypothetical protein